MIDRQAALALHVSLTRLGDADHRLRHADPRDLEIRATEYLQSRVKHRELCDRLEIALPIDGDGNGGQAA